MDKVFLVVTTVLNLPCTSSVVNIQCKSELTVPSIVQEMPNMETCQKAGIAVMGSAPMATWQCRTVK